MLIYAQMVDIRTGEIYETIHKVYTLNKAICLWSQYFPDDESEIVIDVTDSSYDYVLEGKKLASLMKVVTTPGYVSSEKR